MTCAGVSLYRCQAQHQEARKFLENKNPALQGIEPYKESKCLLPLILIKAQFREFQQRLSFCQLGYRKEEGTDFIC